MMRYLLLSFTLLGAATHAPVNNYGGNLPDQMWAGLVDFRYWGVNQATLNEIADWAETVWPAGAWETRKASVPSARVN